MLFETHKVLFFIFRFPAVVLKMVRMLIVELINEKLYTVPVRKELLIAYDAIWCLFFKYATYSTEILLLRS